MRIRVCDDEPEMAQDWVEEIKAVVPDDFDVSWMKDAKDEIAQLINRKKAVEKNSNPLSVDAEFDGIDILVVDYDLLHLDEDGGRSTGEGIARLARQYSKCGPVLVMNQFKGPQFDLGMRGHLDSYASLNIDDELIGAPALWQETPADGGFNPTTWIPMPVLFGAGSSLAESISSGGWDAPLMPIVGLDLGAITDLSDTAFGFLHPDASTSEELASVTVQTFLEQSMDPDSVSKMIVDAPELLSNFAAYRIIKWLDRAVLRPMDVLVDTLHLIDRLPFLMDPAKVNVSNSNSWIAAAADPAENLQWDVVKEFRNSKASEVLGVQVFDWWRIVNDDSIDELQDDYLEQESHRFYLAEDTSRFVELDKLNRYRADFHNFGDRRGIENLGSIRYGPARRLRFV